MEILLLIVIIIYLFITNKKISDKLQALHASVFQMDDEIQFLQQKSLTLEALLKKNNERAAKSESEIVKPIIVEEKPIIVKEKSIIIEEKPTVIVPEKAELVKPISNTTPKVSQVVADKKPVLKSAKKTREIYSREILD